MLPAATTHFVFYGVLLGLAGLLTWLMARRRPPAPSPRWERRTPWLVFLAGALLYAGIGYYYTRACGEHSGDEGHYLMLAESVWHDGDLDLRNNWQKEGGPDCEKTIGFQTMHISELTRPGKWYSYHAPGLPFLLAPAVPAGVAGRHLVLGLIAGAACAGLYLLCRLAGGSPGWSAILPLGLWASVYWTVYTARALPELLGAALTCWLCWSILAQRHMRWRATAVAILCCLYLPWTQIRFYPLSWLGLIMFVVYGVWVEEGKRQKTLRLLGMAVICLLGLAGYQAAQGYFYQGGFSHPVGAMLGSYLPGIWRVFTERPVGVLHVFPLAMWLLAATLVWSVRLPEGRRQGGLYLACLATALVTACSTANYAGGACMPGRFLLAVMPLLVPAACGLWRGLGFPARVWFWVLAWFSIVLLVLELVYLPSLGRSFITPVQCLPVVAPWLKGWRDPVAGTLSAIILFVLTVGLLAISATWRRTAWLIFVIVLGVTIGG